MGTVSIHKAETHLAHLVDRAAAGEEIIITKAGNPVAMLVRFANAKSQITFGLLAGVIRVPGDFDAPLPWAGQPRLFDGLHGVFADSLPDAWGRELMRRRAIANGVDPATLTALDRLAIVGRRGMGALIYEPAVPTDEPDGIDLDSLPAKHSTWWPGSRATTS